MRSRFAYLLTDKSQQQGRRIMLKEVAAETNLSINTLSRWNQPKTMSMVDAETAHALCRYFKCTLNELLEFVTPNGEPVP